MFRHIAKYRLQKQNFFAQSFQPVFLEYFPKEFLINIVVIFRCFNVLSSREMVKIFRSMERSMMGHIFSDGPFFFPGFCSGHRRQWISGACPDHGCGFENIGNILVNLFADLISPAV